MTRFVRTAYPPELNNFPVVIPRPCNYPAQPSVRHLGLYASDGAEAAEGGSISEAPVSVVGHSGGLNVFPDSCHCQLLAVYTRAKADGAGCNRR
jgi:hypothetical protein